MSGERTDHVGVDRIRIIRGERVRLVGKKDDVGRELEHVVQLDRRIAFARAEGEERLGEGRDERDDAMPHVSILRYFGSSASISPSPKKFKPITASMMAMPG